MNTPNQSVRTYSIADDSMLQDSRTTLAHFIGDAQDFAALDPDFDPARVPNFSTLWSAALEAAANAPTDEQMIDMQTGLSQAVDLAVEACRNHFQMAKYYIEKAFPAKKPIWNEFGYDNYEEARRTADRMITFMTVFGKIVEKYQAQLLAANYPQANIDAIAIKKQALIEAKTKQEMAKNSRTGATNERINLLNAVWGFRTQVARAAKNIYANNFTKYDTYLLPVSEETTAAFSLKGTVTDKNSAKALANVAVSLGAESSTSTDSNGKYAFAKLKNGTYTLTFSFAARSVSKEVTYNGKEVTLDVAL